MIVKTSPTKCFYLENFKGHYLPPLPLCFKNILAHALPLPAPLLSCNIFIKRFNQNILSSFEYSLFKLFKAILTFSDYAFIL